SETFPEGYGDFAFQSSDGVIFHFPQFLLSFVSPVFKDMFELGTTVTNEEILTLSENAKTLDILLHLIDPTKEPPPLDWTCVEDVLNAGDKYQVSGVLGWFQRE
ncbi:hypothetical protein CPB86DRAFT_663839, partial [Serendipita vermifera]